MFAQVSRILVGRETGTIGGELKQDAVRFTEIQTSEIESVDFTAVWKAKLVESFHPGAMLFYIRHTERHVMNSPCTGLDWW